MKIQINDCTIRDGGYLFDKDSSSAFIKGIVRGLVDAGIDLIETGFLQNTVNGESLVYVNSVDARRFMPRERGKSEFTGFCDNSRYSIKNLDDYDGRSFEYLRISYAKHESQEALGFVAAAKAKGYKVFANPMDAPSYTVEERAEMISAVNEIKPYCFSIVDTFGTMYLKDLRSIFVQVDKLLDKSIKIGLHSHNNLQLSNALAEVFIDLAVEADRDVVVDASLYGMGRGAGNASTEIIANYLNVHCGANYNIDSIFHAIDAYIIPITSDVSWGYDLPMFICGAEKSHVDNINYLKKKPDMTTNTMYHILRSMDIEKRKRYGSGYSKKDFTQLESAYVEYIENKGKEKS